jgi:hypothetical protein
VAVAVTTAIAKAVASSAVVVVVVSVAATSLGAVLKVKAMAVSSHALMTVVLTAVKTTALKVAPTTVLMHLVATASSHAKAHLAVTSVRVEVLKAVARRAATSVPHVASKIAHHAALMTVPPHVAHALRLKLVAHRLTSQAVQPLASRLVAVLTLKNAHPSHAHLVDE